MIDVCKNCHNKRYIRSRGLCTTCYNNPEIKEQYGRLYVEGQDKRRVTEQLNRCRNEASVKEVYNRRRVPKPRDLPCKSCGTTGLVLAYRGLCYKCYKNPEVRKNYPTFYEVLSDEAKQRNKIEAKKKSQIEQESLTRMLDEIPDNPKDQLALKVFREPVVFLPGSDMKIRVLMYRFIAGIDLFMDGDGDVNIS